MKVVNRVARIPRSAKYGYAVYRRPRPLSVDNSFRALPLGYPFGGPCPQIAGPVTLGDLGKKKKGGLPGATETKKKSATRISKDLFRFLDVDTLPEEFYHWTKGKQKEYAQEAKAAKTQALSEAVAKAKTLVLQIQQGRIAPDAAFEIPSVPFEVYGREQKDLQKQLEYFTGEGLTNAMAQARLSQDIASINIDFDVPEPSVVDTDGGGAGDVTTYYDDTGASEVDWGSGVVYPPGYDPNPPITTPQSFAITEQGDLYTEEPVPDEGSIFTKMGDKAIWIGGILATVVTGLTLWQMTKRKKRR